MIHSVVEAVSTFVAMKQIPLRVITVQTLAASIKESLIGKGSL